MGLIDDLDVSADHEHGHGFDKSVCEGCPKLNSGTISSCGICGCPLTTLSLVKGGSPPSECIRLDQHEGK
jgi:hypothetical protein